MNKTIDCLFIGHNEMDFSDYETQLREMSAFSGAYRDLNLNFIRYNSKLYTASDIFNLFYLNGNENPWDSDKKPLNVGDTFSAAIAYLGSYLDRRGFTFDYVNSFREHKEELAELLLTREIRTIAITTTLYVSVFPILEIMQFIKKYNREAKVIIGGPFVATQCRAMAPLSLEYLFKSIDADFYVNSSQGEAALVKLINTLKNDLPLEQVNNLYYKTDNGFVAAPVLEEDNDLSENMVNWDLFSDRVGEFAAVRTSISCPFGCSFCGFPEHAGRYRTARVEAVEEELNRLAGITSLKSINFIDDTFNVPPKRFKEILRIMIKNNYPFKWMSHYRCQFADRETIQLMKESGCEGVFLGIESGSNHILKNMNKKATVEKYLEGIALLKEYGILTYGSFIIGFPGETDETVQDTIRFIKEAGLDFFRAQLWYCDTITPIWQKREEFKISGSQFEWSHATMDSRRACDYVEEIFLTIDNPTWVPQYNFECESLFHLLHRGLSPEQVKDFLKGFNNGIREKLKDPSREEAGAEVIKQIKQPFQGMAEPVNTNEENIKDKHGVTVNF
jgi:radical SAM PhpK family P-methyltransferase